MIRAAILHGGGYVGRELIHLLLKHPHASLSCVTSRTYAGAPLDTPHPALRGQHNLHFTDPAELDHTTFDVVFVAAEHGIGAASVKSLLAGGFTGDIIDMSSDFRFSDVDTY